MEFSSNELKQKISQRELKKQSIIEIINENKNETLNVIIAKLHFMMSKKTAKEWLEAMHINNEIELFEEPKGTYRARVKKK